MADWQVIKTEYITTDTSYRKLAQKYGIHYKVEKAISELDLQLYKHTDKTKVIEYNNDRRPDKPTKETVHEEEKLLEVKSIIDRQGLKQIASALRDIKEVKMLRSELDRQEQEARIANLTRSAQQDDRSNDAELTVVGLPEEFMK